MITVSVNAFDDAHLLADCLESVRDHLPDATIQVVDGRYETHPAPADNSTDATPDIATEYGADYYPDGSYPDEASKHRHRISLAPDGEFCLFIDADERLLAADARGLDPETGYLVRIFNAFCYGQELRYYPRLFYPGTMADIPRVDRFVFEGAQARTDQITICHRADLRSESYREAKMERYDNEQRDNWYREYVQADREGEQALDLDPCPECGQQSMSTSRVTGYGTDPEFSTVAACMDPECRTSIVPYDIGEYRYVPERIGEGFDEDPERVQVELMDALEPGTEGWRISRILPPAVFGGWLPNARLWVEANLQSEVASAST